MKTNITMEQREAIPNKVRSVLQADGLWTVYETGDTLPTIQEVAPVVEVTKLQFKLALAKTGLLKQVKTYIDSMPEDTDLRVYWEEAPIFRRDHPLIVATAKALDKTDDEVDRLFALALTMPQ